MREIAVEFDLSHARVHGIIESNCPNLLGHIRKHPGPRPRYNYSEIVRLRRDGLTYGEIADRIGCVKRTVATAVASLAPELRRFPKGKHPRLLQRNADIISRRRRGETFREIADHHGILFVTAHAVVREFAPELIVNNPQESTLAAKRRRARRR